jgi:hypothetical protein
MIKTFKQFLNEEISGTELVGPVGPAYGETRLQNKTITSHQTTVKSSSLTGEIYTEDDYNDLYNQYLISGGEPITSGFSQENIDIMLDFLENN